MRHSCLASHLSGESAPLLDMGNVKPPPGIRFVFQPLLFIFPGSAAIKLQRGCAESSGGLQCSANLA